MFQNAYKQTKASNLRWSTTKNKQNKTENIGDVQLTPSRGQSGRQLIIAALAWEKTKPDVQPFLPFMHLFELSYLKLPVIYQTIQYCLMKMFCDQLLRVL